MTIQQPRVIVGIEDSVTGWAALRTAVTLAEQRNAVLHAVRVLPVATDSRPTAAAGLREDMIIAAQCRVADAFAHALGAPPRNIPVLVTVVAGPTGPALVQLADRADDLLVLGARRRHRWLGHHPGHYCCARAACPVLVVPAPEFARTGSTRALTRALRRDLDRLTPETLAGAPGRSDTRQP
jgi:nucleotide-binding universal stress UspA family protein